MLNPKVIEFEADLFLKHSDFLFKQILSIEEKLLEFGYYINRHQDGTVDIKKI